MRKTIAVIGEGITEKYYIESLKGLSPFSLLPKELGKKASNLKKLETDIKSSITAGYDEVYCLIDMDNKKEGENKTKYENLKRRYHNKIHEIKKQGIECKVSFIETERCIELWFLFHFLKQSTTHEFLSYKEVEKELQKFRKNYSKQDKYFKSIGSLHEELTSRNAPKGSLKQAIKNAENSIISKNKENRDYTYSEMHLFIKALGIE